MEEVLKVAIREGRGTRAAKRLRNEGQIPAVLYGHGEDTVSLTVPAADFNAALRHGSRVLDLEGGVKEKAFIRDVQWDTFGVDVLHIDFTRVSASELVVSTVAIELRGVAPGSKEGGVVEQPLHQIEVELPASKMVDHIELSINELHLDETLTIADLELPEGGRALEEPSVVIAQCVPPKAESEVVEPVDGAEPEVIGEKSDESDEG